MHRMSCTTCRCRLLFFLSLKVWLSFLPNVLYYHKWHVYCIAECKLYNTMYMHLVREFIHVLTTDMTSAAIGFWFLNFSFEYLSRFLQKCLFSFFLFGTRVACTKTEIFSDKLVSKNAVKSTIVLWITACEKNIWRNSNIP